MTKCGKVLLVDDEVRLSESIQILLSGPEIEVISVHTGEEALNEIKCTSYDAFLFDIGLPDMNGFELLTQARVHQKDTPVIFMTGHTTVETAIRALKNGAYSFLRKPIEFEELKMTVVNAMEKKRLIERNRTVTVRLKKSEQRYRRLVQNSPDLIYTLDSEGRFLFVNNAVENLLGYRSTELLNVAYVSLISPDTPRVEGGLRLENGLHLLTKKDGNYCPVETSLTPIRNGRGTIIGCQGVDRDISRRRALEDALTNSFAALRDTHGAAILGLATLVEYRDIGTGLHLERIRNYVELLARTLAMLPKYEEYITETYIKEVSQSSILHDIGKVGIPDAILLKQDKLTKDEFNVMKTHCIIGGDAIKAIESRIDGQSFLTLGKKIAYCHHERWDGTGYPYGLKGHNIPLSARQVSVADVYDALTSERAYKPRFSHDYAKDVLMDGRGTQFDPDVVDAFMERERDFFNIQNVMSEERRAASCITPEMPFLMPDFNSGTSM
jgi:PAS domain S-box-containing protein